MNRFLSRFEKISFSFLVLAAFFFFISVLYCTFFYFELADEGSYLYALYWGKQTVYISPFYLIFHCLGLLWNHSLLGYRLLKLGVVFFSSLGLGHFLWAYLFHSKENRSDFYPTFLRLILGVGIFSFTFSGLSKNLCFNYNTLSFSMGALWLATVFWGLTRSRFGISSFFLGLFTVGACFSRIPFGIALIFMTLGLMIFFRRKWGYYPFLIYGVTVGLGLVGAWFFFSHTLMAIFQASMGHLSGSHQSPLQHIWNDFSSWLLSLFLLAGVFFGVFVWRASSIRMGVGIILLLAYSFAAVFINGFFRFDEFLLRHFLGMLVCLVPSLYMAGLVYRQGIASHRRYLGVIFLSFSVAWMTSLGSNLSLFEHCSEYAFPILGLPFLVVLILFLKQYRSYFWIGISFLLVIVLGLGALIFNGLWSHPYRNQSIGFQTAQSRFSPTLKGVHIEESLAVNIDAVYSVLFQKGFDFKQDRLIVYPDAPGFLSALGAKSFGTPWTGRDADHHDEASDLMIRYLELEPFGTPIRHVYILLLASLDAPVASYLDTRLREDVGFSSRQIGVKGQYSVILPYFRDYQLVVKGPYRLK